MNGTLLFGESIFHTVTFEAGPNYLIGLNRGLAIAMPRSRPIPQQILQAAAIGEPEALRRLGGLLSPGNVTTDIVDLLFKHLTTYPVLEQPSGRQFALSATVAACPSASLCALWKITASRERLNTDVQSSLDHHFMESADAVLRWARFCLHTGWPCVSLDSQPAAGAATLRVRQYLALAEVLVSLVRSDDDCTLALYSSRTFVDLFVELWLAGERSNEGDGSVIHRLVDTSSTDGCNIINLADTILSNDVSREVFLSRCTNQATCRQVALAFKDRVSRGWEGDSVYIPNWARSLEKLILATSRVYGSSTLLCRRLTTIGYLPELASQVAALVDTIYAEPKIHELNALVAHMLFRLANLSINKDLPFASREIWTQLHAGHYIESLFRATVLASKENMGPLGALLSILELMGNYTTYPRVFGGLSRKLEGISLEQLKHCPEAAAQWATFVGAYDNAVGAVKCLRDRPSVYFCDYLPCALSGRESETASKECSECHSVVYCSFECQRRDWEERHRDECKHARRTYSSRITSHTWYDNKTRASQAVLLEVYSKGTPEVDKTLHTNHAVYPVLDFISVISHDNGGSYLQTTAECGYWDEWFPQTYLRPRFESLTNAYRSGIPQGWLLTEGIFASIGDEHAIHLTVLLKSVGEWYRAVYCVPRYRYARRP